MFDPFLAIARLNGHFLRIGLHIPEYGQPIGQVGSFEFGHNFFFKGPVEQIAEPIHSIDIEQHQFACLGC